MVIEKRFVIVLLLALTVRLEAQRSVIVRAGEGRIEGEYIVVLEDGVPTQVAERVARIAAAHDVQPETIWSDALQAFFVRTSEARAEALSRHPGVAYVEENAGWWLSAVPTNVDPAVCNPAAEDCARVADNRLWHLDQADQNRVTPTYTYSSCTTGDDVTVYIVDTGVNKYHQEFAPGQVLEGVDTSGDGTRADDPCIGFALPPVESELNRGPAVERANYDTELRLNGHGTAVASLVGGQRVGIAKQATIVPVKVGRCDHSSARSRRPNRSYVVGETMFVPTTNNSTAYGYYKATTAGVTNNSEVYATQISSIEGSEWCDDGSPSNGTPAAQCTGIMWRALASSTLTDPLTTTALIAGLDWISGDKNFGPKAHAIVTLSTFRVRTEPQTVETTSSVAAAIRKLLALGMTVIASANNQNGDACDTVPGLLSENNPTTGNRADVITVGGSMITNRPWNIDISDVTAHNQDAVEANGGSRWNATEPPHNKTKPVAEARWICGPGDSSICSNNTPIRTVDPSNISTYRTYQAGSNGGACVTLFAPAKNITVASIAGVNAYRDPRLGAGHASGTSWSAPIVAGLAARILEVNRTFLAPDVRAMLLANSAATLDPATLNTVRADGVTRITGTPNKVVRLADVNITQEPASTPAAESGPTMLSIQASGTTAVSYQWFRVNDDFDVATYRAGADASTASTKIAGATASTYAAPHASAPRGYWVRVTNACGSADSQIAVVVPPPAGAPTNLTAAAADGVVTLTWTPWVGAEQYEVQRRVAGQDWTHVALLANTVTTFSESPTAPGGMVVYRVRAVTGGDYLPPWQLAGRASNNDFVNLNTYETLATSNTTIKAQHLIDVRSAANTLCDIISVPRVFTPSEVTLSSVRGTLITAAHFTSSITKVNTVRTHSLLAVGAATSFGTELSPAEIIAATHMERLRDAVR